MVRTPSLSGDLPTTTKRASQRWSTVVRQGVKVIVAAGTQSALAAQKATSTIPIVFLVVPDPVGVGLVKSLARPGGNITGFTNVNEELAGKRLAILKEAFPNVERIGMPTSDCALCPLVVKEFEAAAHSLRIKLQVVAVRDPEEFDAMFAQFAKARVGAIFLLPQTFLFSNRRRLIELASRHRLPVMGWVRELVDDGAALSYGPSNFDMQRRAGGYVARILHGAKPTDLPVEQPARLNS